MQRTKTDRPYSRESTAALRSLVEQSNLDFDVLHKVFVELLFRERPAACDLRKIVGERLKMLSEKTPNEQYFKWPTTDALGGSGEIDDSFFQHRQGMLGYLGYKVGASGVSASQRHELLDFVYSGTLPLLNSKEYMADWGTPNTANRLRKMADSIAAFARNAKRGDPKRLSVAISEWELDLEYLRTTYYVGRYDFLWPVTTAL